MKKISKPTDENGAIYDANAVFEACISGTDDVALLARLRKAANDVVSKSNDYDTNAGRSQLHNIQKDYLPSEITDEKEMVGVYTSGMVNRKAGRKIYDRIKVQESQCPFCGIGTVSTLDHYLPKSQYPILSVTPNNLVPACKDCQGNKGEFYPSSAEEQILHPYYDNVDSDIWLKASIEENPPASFRFYADPPATWCPVKRDRVRKHLAQLQLPKLFASNAGSLLGEIRGRLKKLHSAGGKNEVKKHLEEELLSFEQVQKNSWKTAMYRAAIASDWFCNGGFR
jgi:hypothetical protein